MRKTSVYLSEQEAEALRRSALREGRSQADLIREGVRRVVTDAESKPRQFRSMGKGRGGPYRPWSAAELYDKVMGRR